MIGAKLHHRYPVAFVQTKERQGQADKIVEVALGFQKPSSKRFLIHVSFFENRRKHLFGGGLAIDPVIANTFGPYTLAPVMSQIAEGS